jgi:hypothetical protein
MAQSIFMHIVGIFDSPEYSDRYTIAFDWVDNSGRREVVSLSDKGVTAWGSMRDSDLNDLKAITKSQLPEPVIKYLERLECRPSGRVGFKQSPSMTTPTTPKDRLIDATELAHRISSVLIEAAKQAWENRVDTLQQGLPDADTWPGQALAIDVRDFEFAVGAKTDNYYGSKMMQITDDIIVLAHRPVNKFALMPDRTRPEEPWANTMIVRTLENIAVLNRDMIKAISDFVSLH